MARREPSRGRCGQGVVQLDPAALDTIVAAAETERAREDEPCSPSSGSKLRTLRRSATEALKDAWNEGTPLKLFRVQASKKPPTVGYVDPTLIVLWQRPPYGLRRVLLENARCVQRLSQMEWWPVFLPDTKMTMMWDLLGLLLINYEAITIPYRLAFQAPVSPFFKICETIVMVFFLLDVVFNFFLGFVHDGMLVVDPTIVIHRYSTGWFVPDVVASFPYVLVATADQQVLRFLRFVRLIRLLRMTKLKRTFRQLENAFSGVYWGPSVIEVGNIVLSLFLVAHFSACVWFLLAAIDLDEDCRAEEPHLWLCDNGTTWLTSSDAWELEYTHPEYQMYINSMYFALATMTTVGFGDIHPKSNEEKMFIIPLFLVSILAFSGCVGRITELGAQLMHAQAEFRLRVADFSRYMKWRGLPTQLQQRAIRYAQFAWEKDTNMKETEKAIFSTLSPTLRQQTVMHVHGPLLAKAPFLHWVSHHSVGLEHLLGHAEGCLRGPGDVLFVQGQTVEALHAVQDGRVMLVRQGQGAECDEHDLLQQLQPLSLAKQQWDQVLEAIARVEGHAPEMQIVGALVLPSPTVVGECFHDLCACLKEPLGAQAARTQAAHSWRELVSPRPPSASHCGPSSPGTAGARSSRSRWGSSRVRQVPQSKSAVCLTHCNLVSIQVERIQEVLESLPFLWADLHATRKTYDAEGLLTVHVVRCSDLVNSDTMASSDPYCVLKLVGHPCPDKRTRTVMNDLEPCFDELHQFGLGARACRGAQLEVTVYDEDLFSADESLGFVTVPLADVVDRAGEEIEFDLALDGIDQGRVVFRLKFQHLGDFWRAHTTGSPAKHPSPGKQGSYRHEPEVTPLQSGSSWGYSHDAAQQQRHELQRQLDELRAGVFDQLRGHRELLLQLSRDVREQQRPRPDPRPARQDPRARSGAPDPVPLLARTQVAPETRADQTLLQQLDQVKLLAKHAKEAVGGLDQSVPSTLEGWASALARQPKRDDGLQASRVVGRLKYELSTELAAQLQTLRQQLQAG